MQSVYPVTEASHIAAARRGVGEMAARAGLDETDVGGLSIALTEAATNILKHGGGGEILARPLSASDRGVEILAIDRGPGISDVAVSMRDGHSTTGTAGTGLGAMQRLASEFHLYSGGAVPGVVLRMVFRTQGAATGPEAMFELGVVCVPMMGESACGDAWAENRHPYGGSFLIADGLGHGPNAARASQTAVTLFDQYAEHAPGQLMHELHMGLRATRGAAAAIIELDFMRKMARFAGVGNISGCLIGLAGNRHMMSHNGIVGHNVRKIQEFSTPWEAGMLLILHSDGLAMHWNLSRYPGLAWSHPGLIAAVLYRDFSRGRDDTCVLVVKERAAQSPEKDNASP